MTRSKSVWCLAVIVGVLWASRMPALAVRQYKIVDLGSFGGGESRGFGLNNKGQVVGYSTTATGAPHAFVWDSTHGMQDLGTFGYAEGYAYGINDAGRIVGYGRTNSMDHGAILNDKAGAYWAPDPLPGDTMTAVKAVNDLGLSVGYSGTSTYVTHAVVWDKDGHVVQDLGPGRALSVNNNGDVGGYLYEGNPYWGMLSHAFYWSKTSGFERFGWGSRVDDVNDSGRVVGGPTQFGGPDFIWDSVKGITYTDDIGLNGINNLGQVAASITISEYVNHAAFWDTVTEPVDLGVLPGYSNSQVFAINDNGMLVGDSYNYDFKWRATVWIPVVPEPSGLLVLATALPGIALTVRRRRSTGA